LKLQSYYPENLLNTVEAHGLALPFYVNKHSEQKRGKPRMVINYKALNEALMPIRYPLPNKDLLFSKIGKCNVFSKFDLKSGFWQIGIVPKTDSKQVLLCPKVSINGELCHLD
jgi:hypothetical protein